MKKTKNNTILSGKHFEEYVNDAVNEYEVNGTIYPPRCYLNLGDKVLPVTLGDLFRKYDKRFVMSMLKHYFREEKKREIQEALMLIEVWFVDAKNPDIGVRPSQHPDRQEAVLLVGRNKKGDKYAVKGFVIDPKTRKLKERKEMTAASQYSGLLDYVFDESEAILKEYAIKNKVIKKLKYEKN